MTAQDSAQPGEPAARLTQLLSPVVAEVGYDLEDLSVTPAGRRRVVRALVDKDGGVSLDDIADVSRSLSEALDDIDAREPALLEGAYVLEVSSPGVDRPLAHPRHWRRNVKRLVVATLVDGTTATGRLLAVDEDGVTLGERTLAWSELTSGAVQVEFSRKHDPDGPDDSDGSGDSDDPGDSDGQDETDDEDDA